MKARPTLLAIALAATFAAQAASSQQAPAPIPALAVVNGQAVSAEEFERAFAATVRQKFYHRAPPEGTLEAVRREVADGLVDRALILAEAKKRAVKVDEDAIRQVIAGYEKRYGESPNWKQTRERALPQIENELRQKQLLERLEAEVRDVKAPDEADARRFYEANPTLFTEPEQVHVSVILLKVDPSATKAVRDQAREEARGMYERLAGGADFAEMAKLRSADSSAAKGGDLGYLHRGMLGEALHVAIDALKDGEVGKPTDVLEGVAIFKLHQRREARQRQFADVRERAGELLKRERAEGAWKQFVAELRRDAVIQTNEALYPKPATAAAEEGRKDETWAVQQSPRGP